MKPDYSIPEDVRNEAIKEQLRAIFNDYGKLKTPDEFTIQEFADMQEEPTTYDRAKIALQKAEEAGRVTCRRTGSRSYYKLAGV